MALPWTLGSAPSPRRPSSPRSCAADSSPVSVGFTPMSVCSLGPARRGPGTSVTRSCGAVDSRSSDLVPCQGLPPAPQSIADFEGLLLGVLPGSIPGSGRSSGEGTGYPLQCSWASLVAQLVKNPPAMRETWILSLGRQDPLEKGKATHSSILARSHRVAKSRT